MSFCPRAKPIYAHGTTKTLLLLKNDVHDGKSMWLIYAADGTKIAATDDRDFAFVMAKQNDFTPCSVH